MRIIIFALLILSLLLGICGCKKKKGTGGYTEGNLPIEVDYQSGKEPYGDWGWSAVTGMFPDCAKPAFKIDDTELVDTMIYWNRMEQYFMTHHDPFEKHWLCGISKFRNENGDPIDTIAGRTHMAGLYSTYSFVCYDVTTQSSEPGKYTLKTCCHELGHQVAKLKHLCNLLGNWDDDHHDDMSCLMGQGEVSSCTGQDLLQFIHFCDICKIKLCESKGIEENP